MGPARGVGGMGGMNVLGIISMLSRFGWKGILIGIVIAGFLMFGGGNLCAGGGGGSQAVGPQKTTPAQDEQAKFVGYVFDDIQDSWAKARPGYQPAKIIVFTGAVESACGTTSSAVGPFYCPTDQRVYIDLQFYSELSKRFGAPGDFAQAYVIAHEIGHHLQQQAGVLGGGASDAIAVELQADCLAGVWGKSAEARGKLEIGDVDEALGAASAIGDDKIQQKTQGRIQPETWTHGSAAQRSAAWRKGYKGGTAETCGL